MMYIYTHRGTKKHIQKCIDTKCIRANFPDNSPLVKRMFDHNKTCVWVSTGYPNVWNYLFSGMIQYIFDKEPRKYYVTFTTANKAKAPSGLFKKPFFKSQRVFEHDILLKDDDILSYDDGRSKK